LVIGLGIWGKLFWDDFKWTELPPTRDLESAFWGGVSKGSYKDKEPEPVWVPSSGECAMREKAPGNESQKEMVDDVGKNEMAEVIRMLEESTMRFEVEVKDFTTGVSGTSRDVGWTAVRSDRRYDSRILGEPESLEAVKRLEDRLERMEKVQMKIVDREKVRDAKIDRIFRELTSTPSDSECETF
jgi:hypothetical protein